MCNTSNEHCAPYTRTPKSFHQLLRLDTRCRCWAGLERLQQFMEAVTLDGHLVKTHVYRVTDASDVYRTLRQIDSRSRDAKTFVIDMSTRDSELLLRKIVSFPGFFFRHLLFYCANVLYWIFSSRAVESSNVAIGNGNVRRQIVSAETPNCCYN